MPTSSIMRGSIWSTPISMAGFAFPMSGRHGLRRYSPVLSIILHYWHYYQGQIIGTESSLSFAYQTTYSTKPTSLSNFEQIVLAYDGDDEVLWACDEKGKGLIHLKYISRLTKKSGVQIPGARKVCTVNADLSGLLNNMKMERNSSNQSFWKIDYTFQILFGGTSLKARLVWYEGVSSSFWLYFVIWGLI